MRGKVVKVSDNGLVEVEMLLQEVVDDSKNLVMSSVILPELEGHWTVE